MAKNGNDVLLKSRTSGVFRLVPVKDNIVVERDLMTELKRALLEVKDDISGKKKMKTVESLIDELRNSTL